MIETVNKKGSNSAFNYKRGSCKLVEAAVILQSFSKQALATFGNGNVLTGFEMFCKKMALKNFSTDLIYRVCLHIEHKTFHFSGFSYYKTGWLSA